MRDIQTLLKSGTSPERVADYRWRSAEEVAYYLDGLRSFAHVEVSASLDRNKLGRSYAELVELQGRLDTLTSLDVSVAYELRKHRTRLVPMIRELRTQLEAKRDRALRVLQRCARKAEPVLLQDAVKNAVKFLASRLVNTGATTDYVYATPYGSTGLEFNHYIQIDGLNNPAVGFTYPEYYVVLTARVAPSKTTLHCNTLHDFRAPGAFNVGDELAPNQLLTVLTAMLHADEFVADSDGMELPLIPIDVRWFKTPVTELTVGKRCISGNLNCTQQQAVEYSKMLRKELMAAFARHLPGHNLRTRLERRGNNRWCVQYMAVPVPAAKGLGATGERVLRDQLAFTPDQIAAVRRLLLKGY